MNYFFLSKSWKTGRVWEFGGLWNESAWNRKPHLKKQSLCIKENSETLCLYEAESSILMVEVMPKTITHPTIGQVVLKRLLSAEQVIERLCQEESIFHLPSHSENITGDGSEQRSILHCNDTGQNDTGQTAEPLGDSISQMPSSPQPKNMSAEGKTQPANHRPQTSTGEQSAIQASAVPTTPVNQEPSAIN